MRVESQRTRQALLVVGDEMETDPPPEKLELFTEDGLAVDVGKDRTRARWRGTWSPIPAAPYEQNDFVMHDEKLYILADFEAYNGVDAPPASGWALMTISGGMKWMGEWDVLEEEYKEGSVTSYEGGLWHAPGDIETGTVPGWEPEPPANLAINRAVQFTEADRLASEVPITLVIGPGEGEQHRDNDITSGFGAVVLIDVTGAETGRTLNIRPVSRDDESAEFTASPYYAGNSFDMSNNLTWTDAEVDSQTVKTMDISSNDDRYIHMYFDDNGIDGVIEVWVSDNTDLVAPPVVDTVFRWELMLAATPIPGFEGDWVDIRDYADSSIVRHTGAIWMADGDIDAGLEPEEPTGVEAPKWELLVPTGGGGGGDLGETEDWHQVGSGGEPAFTNSWDDLYPTDYPVLFRKDALGVVEIRGLIDAGTFGLAAFTLPAGYRPSDQEKLWFQTVSNNAGSWVVGVVVVQADGAVIPQSGGSDWIALQCRFGT